MANFRNVRVGDDVTILFKGSKVLGNEPYTASGYVTHIAENLIETDIAIIEFYDSRWRYGMSGEVAILKSLTRSEDLINLQS